MISRFTILFISFLLSFSVSADETWAIDCNSGLGRIVLKENKADLVVNLNQIVISAKIVKNGNSISFYLDEPIELGRGGMMLDWDSFSKNEKIAVVTINGNKASLSWNGFFETNKSQYIWVSESEFYSQGGGKNVTINRCEI